MSKIMKYINNFFILRKSRSPIIGQDYFLPHMLKYHFNTILDIGVGQNTHVLDFFIKNGKKVFGIDIVKRIDYSHENFTFIEGDFLTFNFNQKFDAILASHVLEHTQNIGFFLDKIYNLLEDDGVFFCLVPPYKSQIVGGHITVGWNIGTLMYNLILRGFDVKQGRFKKMGYNIAAFVKKRKDARIPEKLIFDIGDIEKLENFWPDKSYFKQGFEGNIDQWNWLD